MTLHQTLSKELRDLFVSILRRSLFRPPHQNKWGYSL